MNHFFPGKIKSLLFFSATVLFFSSCISSKKINELNLLKKENHELQAKLQTAIGSANEERGRKQNAAELDTVSSSRIGKFLDSVSQSIVFAKQATDVFGAAKPKAKDIQQRLSAEKALGSSLSASAENVGIINELLDRNTFIKFNMAAFFKPGKYEIAYDNKGAAHSAYKDMVDSILYFSQRFPGKNMAAFTIVLGYADGTDVAEGSELYNTISTFLDKTNPSRQELNWQISTLRAEAVSSVIREMFCRQLCETRKYKNLTSQIFSQGRGEAYPSPLIKDYATEDERRRVVIAYWTVLPE